MKDNPFKISDVDFRPPYPESVELWEEYMNAREHETEICDQQNQGHTKEQYKVAIILFICGMLGLFAMAVGIVIISYLKNHGL